jgi:hypothetical protein
MKAPFYRTKEAALQVPYKNLTTLSIPSQVRGNESDRVGCLGA